MKLKTGTLPLRTESQFLTVRVEFADGVLVGRGHSDSLLVPSSSAIYIYNIHRISAQAIEFYMPKIKVDLFKSLAFYVFIILYCRILV